MHWAAASIAVVAIGCGRLAFDGAGLDDALGFDVPGAIQCDGGAVYVDGDGDGWGGIASNQCDVIPGTTMLAGDCNDGDDQVNPDASDDCQRNRDCDGTWAVSVPTMCPLIQPLLDLSAAMGISAIVTLESGTHVEDLRFVGAPVAVVGMGPGATILQGTGTGPVVVFRNGGATVPGLSRMTVTGGVCEVIGDACHGGGIRVDQSSPLLSELEITGNVANAPLYGYGGGIALLGTEARLSDVEIHGNTSNYYGGGIVHRSSDSSTLERVRIVNNGGATYGGGVASYYSSPRYENVIFSANDGNYGGAMLLQGGAPRFVNITVVGNSCTDGCGVNLISSASVAFVSSTFSGGQALGSGGAVELEAGSALSVSYSNFFGNGTGPFVGMTSPVGTSGNLAVDPKFVDPIGSDPRGWDLRLGATSTLRNAGDPAVLDRDGSRADIGAFGGPRSWP